MTQKRTAKYLPHLNVGVKSAWVDKHRAIIVATDVIKHPGGHCERRWYAHCVNFPACNGLVHTQTLLRKKTTQPSYCAACFFEWQRSRHPRYAQFKDRIVAYRLVPNYKKTKKRHACIRCDEKGCDKLVALSVVLSDPKNKGKCSVHMRKRHAPFMYALQRLQRHYIGVVDANGDDFVSLSVPYYLKLMTQSHCHYCSGPLRKRLLSGGASYGRLQLDRKNNRFGYRDDNLVSCCWKCNKRKGAFLEYEEMILLSPLYRGDAANLQGNLKKVAQALKNRKFLSPKLVRR